GLGRRELRRLVDHRPGPVNVGLDHDELAARLVGPEGLTSKQTTFTTPELVCAVATSARSGAPVETVLATADELTQLATTEPVLREGVPGRPARFTTGELLQLERDVLQLALTGRDVATPGPDKKWLLRTLMQSRELSGEQRMLVHEASIRSDRVVCVVGAAGAGKTSALRLVVGAYRENGVPVLGAAPSGRAADELAAATGVAA